ncbi:MULTISPECIES: MFS transporter [Dermacoccus]|uniref:MFS transporter n=1 Tax=Dermacoccus TaxID=57495 RepID=UPI00101D3D7B|nr:MULTISPECIES: MFS transporter [Dermacoccus]RYI22261.1 MFS transporter [Dermacoccus sp. 147Ba]
MPSASMFRDLPRPAKWMLTSLVFDFVGTGLIMPFAVVYLHEVRDFSLQTAGVLLALPAIVGLLAVGPGGVLIDRFGARRVVIAAVSLEIVAQVLMANALTVPVAATSLVCSGLATGVIFPAVQAMVATVMPTHQRQHYFGLSFTLLNLGLGIGGMLGGAVVDVERPGTFERIYYIDAVTFLIPLMLYLGPLRRYGGPVAHGASSGDDGAMPVSGGYRLVLRDPAMRLLVVLGFVTAFIGYAQFGVGFQAFSRTVAHISTQVLGWAYAANTAVIVVAQLFVLKFVAGRRRTRALLVMCVLWAISWSVLGVAGLAGESNVVLASVLVCASAAIFGVGETFLQPTLPAMVNDLAPDHLRGRYNSASAGAFHIAEIVGPPFAGLLIGHALAGWYAVALVAGCAVAAWVTIVVERQLSPKVNGVGVSAPEEIDVEGEMALEVQRAKLSTE